LGWTNKRVIPPQNYGGGYKKSEKKKNKREDGASHNAHKRKVGQGLKGQGKKRCAGKFKGETDKQWGRGTESAFQGISHKLEGGVWGTSNV